MNVDAPLIDVLGDSGLPTGERLTSEDIHKTGALHHVVHLYLLNKEGTHILLQQRASGVSHYADMWSISVTGHIHAGEGATDALWRELQEELGLTRQEADIEFVFSYRRDSVLRPDYIDRQIQHVFLGHLKREKQTFSLNNKEVQGVDFVPCLAFKEMVLHPRVSTMQTHNIVPVYREALKALLRYNMGL